MVDDDEAIRESLGEALTNEGYDVLYAENGRQALDILRSSSPGLMLLDLMMPVMSGWEVLEELQSQNATVPVVVVSAMCAPGVKACIQKPIDLGDLLRVVAEYCVPKNGGGKS